MKEVIVYLDQPVCNVYNSASITDLESLKDKKFYHLSSYISCNVFNVMRINTVFEACDFSNQGKNVGTWVKTDAACSEKITSLIKKMDLK